MHSWIFCFVVVMAVAFFTSMLYRISEPLFYIAALAEGVGLCFFLNAVDKHLKDNP